MNDEKNISMLSIERNVMNACAPKTISSSHIFIMIKRHIMVLQKKKDIS